MAGAQILSGGNMVVWSWWRFHCAYALFGLGTVFSEMFGRDAWIAVLLISFLLGFRRSDD